MASRSWRFNSSRVSRAGSDVARVRARGASVASRPGQVKTQWTSWREDDSALNGVLKFAHVARPIIGGELAQCGLRDSQVGAIHSPRALPHEMCRERWDVFAPFAQRRDFDREDAQAIEKVPAETARIDLFLQVAIGRSDDPDIDFARTSVADALQFLLLQNAQQFRLHRERHFADFVEKQCAAVRQFEAAGLVFERAGERTSHVAEEFALEQALGHRAAIQLDEGAAISRAVLVDCTRDEFFARAAFSR